MFYTQECYNTRGHRNKPNRPRKNDSYVCSTGERRGRTRVCQAQSLLDSQKQKLTGFPFPVDAPNGENEHLNTDLENKH